MSLLGGMPAPLPSGLDLVSRLGDSVLARFQTVSFFILVFLLCAAGVWALWRYLRRDFPALPPLSFGRASALVFLWGLLFVIVLTMISGARELMTPGAWEKQGFTYRLATPPTVPAEPDPEAERRDRLAQLRFALWQFAANRSGRFPSADEWATLPAELREVPGTGGLPYEHNVGLSVGSPPKPLAWEPELTPGRRLVLLTDGDIRSFTSAEWRAVGGGVP